MNGGEVSDPLKPSDSGTTFDDAFANCTSLVTHL